MDSDLDLDLNAVDSDLDSDLKAVDLDFLVSAGLGLGLGLGYWWTCYKSASESLSVLASGISNTHTDSALCPRQCTANCRRDRNDMQSVNSHNSMSLFTHFTPEYGAA